MGKRVEKELASFDLLPLTRPSHNLSQHHIQLTGLMCSLSCSDWSSLIRVSSHRDRQRLHDQICFLSTFPNAAALLVHAVIQTTDLTSCTRQEALSSPGVPVISDLLSELFRSWDFPHRLVSSCPSSSSLVFPFAAPPYSHTQLLFVSPSKSAKTSSSSRIPAGCSRFSGTSLPQVVETSLPTRHKIDRTTFATHHHRTFTSVSPPQIEKISCPHVTLPPATRAPAGRGSTAGSSTCSDSRKITLLHFH